MPRRRKSGTRIKEIASIEGVRDNQLLGYGLVVGLNGTGEQAPDLLLRAVACQHAGTHGCSGGSVGHAGSNMAAVMVTANLPPYAQPGTRIDVQASAIGDASNLQGGTLILNAFSKPPPVRFSRWPRVRW
ncbi:MAG: flagellar basal body P-ring protein FlgI [Paludibaculum sp.]